MFVRYTLTRRLMRIKRLYRHSICWATWFFCSMLVFGLPQTPTGIASRLVQFLLQAMLFYLLYRVAMRYFGKVTAQGAYTAMPVKTFRFYFQHREVAVMAGCVAGFVLFSFMADVVLLHQSPWPASLRAACADLEFYFARAGLYIGAAFFYATIQLVVRNKNKTIGWQREFIEIVRTDNQRLREAIKKEQEDKKILVNHLLSHRLN